MIIPPFYDADTRTYHFHNSGLAKYMECPRLFYHTYLSSTPSYSLNPELSTDLFVGGVFAKTLEETRYLFMSDPTTDIYTFSRNRLIELYGDHEPTVKAKSLDIMLQALSMYLNRYVKDTQPYRLQAGTPAIELEFNVPFHSSLPYQINYFGRMDSLNFTEDDRVWLVDDKVTTDQSAIWGLKFPYDSQMLGYLWVLLTHFNLTVKGVEIRKIQVASNKAPIVSSLFFAIPPRRIVNWYNNTLILMQQVIASHQEVLSQCNPEVSFPQHRSYKCVGTNRQPQCISFSNCYGE